MAKKTKRGQKQCPKCKAWVKGTRTKACPKCNYQFNGKAEAKAATEPAPAEKKADTVTFEQVRAVTMTVKAIGGGGLENAVSFGRVTTLRARLLRA